jgi:hypothetical protein
MSEYILLGVQYGFVDPERALHARSFGSFTT